MKFILILSDLFLSFGRGVSQTPGKAEVVSLTGTNIYYEVYGKGEPLFLLHGYTQSSKYCLPINLKSHGKSSPPKEKLSIKLAASDIDALTKYLMQH
ncbi:MAG: hypothetical protein ABJA71_10465 [Ginsengibacter sp.]